MYASFKHTSISSSLTRCECSGINAMKKDRQKTAPGRENGPLSSSMALRRGHGESKQREREWSGRGKLAQHLTPRCRFLADFRKKSNGAKIYP